MHRRAPALAAALLVVVAPSALAGCTSDTAGPAAEPAAGPRAAGSDGALLQPGEPGEPNATVDPDDADLESGDQWSHADVAFMQMMIPHHAQAMVMADLAERHADDRRVRVLAERIRGAQGPEILAMAAWLDERDLGVPSAAENPHDWDHSAHGHHAMRGMLTQAQLDRLAEARGRAFDRLFLRRMIAHHEGAIRMADDAAAESTDARVGEVIAEVGAVQSGEIARMRDLLDELS